LEISDQGFVHSYQNSNLSRVLREIQGCSFYEAIDLSGLPASRDGHPIFPVRTDARADK